MKSPIKCNECGAVAVYYVPEEDENPETYWCEKHGVNRIDSRVLDEVAASKSIYVLMSFRVYKTDNGNQRIEDGRKFWFSCIDKALEYINMAGKPVPGEENVFYDEPYECRWKYLVIEEVLEGPISINKVVGWWEAIIEDGNLVGYRKLDSAPIERAESTFNFTGIGS